jgi:hypothetical protein
VLLVAGDCRVVVEETWQRGEIRAGRAHAIHLGEPRRI